ncbi:MAG: PhnD/SsuA/transferrin family substrate-binding protein [Methylococcaceae bacterium]
MKKYILILSLLFTIGFWVFYQINSDNDFFPLKLINQSWQAVSNINSAETEAYYQPTFNNKSIFNNEVYIIGIHPLHNPKRLFEVYAPIIEFIDQQLPDVSLKLEASRNYEEFEKKLYSGHFDFAMPNPYQTLKALNHGYQVFGKMADDTNFCGIILVRKDSGINQISDLKGKIIAYPAKTALAATMMPQQYLQTHGLNINTDIENRYVGSQESAIMNVLLGSVAAAATWPVPWKTFSSEFPDKAAQLEVKWRTSSLPNNGWVVRNDIPKTVVEQFANQLFSLQNTPAGQTMLSAVPVSRFEPATSQTYAPVKAFLDNFSKTVRPIE